MLYVMNKKLKLYSTLFIVALIVGVFVSTVRFEKYSYASSEDTRLEYVEEPTEYVLSDKINDEGKVIEKNRKPELAFTVSVEPVKNLDAKVLMSESMGQRYKVNMQSVSLALPLDKVKAENSGLYYVWRSVMLIGIIVGGVLGIWTLWLVYKVVRNVRRGEIFVAQFATLLEKLGKLLVAYCVMDFVVKYVFAQYCIHNIYIAGYHIVFRNTTNGMDLFTGLALMIISQIILMGKELKEEQDLTI